MKSNKAIHEEMSQRTYVVEHNPNCPSPYLIRLCGPGRGVIDKKPVYGNQTQDVLGYGKTFEMAARRALSAYRKQLKEFHAARKKWRKKKTRGT